MTDAPPPPAPAGGTDPSPVVRLDEVVTAATVGNGVHWTLGEGQDLNANLVHLDPGGSVAAHVNGAVDVLVVVLAGTGTLVLDGTTSPLAAHTAALAPRGTERAVHAGEEGLTYLTIHRRRGPMTIGPPPARP